MRKALLLKNALISGLLRLDLIVPCALRRLFHQLNPNNLWQDLAPVHNVIYHQRTVRK